MNVSYQVNTTNSTISSMEKTKQASVFQFNDGMQLYKIHLIANKKHHHPIPKIWWWNTSDVPINQDNRSISDYLWNFPLSIQIFIIH